MASKRADSKPTAAVRRALALATEAMDLLDAHRGPPQASAHLDLARQILQQELRG